MTNEPMIPPALRGVPVNLGRFSRDDTLFEAGRQLGRARTPWKPVAAALAVGHALWLVGVMCMCADREPSVHKVAPPPTVEPAPEPVKSPPMPVPSRPSESRSPWIAQARRLELPPLAPLNPGVVPAGPVLTAGSSPELVLDTF